MIWLLCLVGIGALCAVLYGIMTGPGEPAPIWLTEWKYAHRGLHSEGVPENTLPAFEAAVRAGYGIELDVRLSLDGEVVVFHDSNLERLTGFRGSPECFPYHELEKLAVDGTAYGIPKLAQVMELVAGRVPLLIETKNMGHAGELEKRVHELLRDYSGRTAVQSFSPFSMRWFKEHEPKEPRGQLSSSFASEPGVAPWYQLFAVKHLLTNILCRPNFISYGAGGLSQPVVRCLRRLGTPVLAWTVTSAQEAEKIAQLCDTIIFEGFLPERRQSHGV